MNIMQAQVEAFHNALEVPARHTPTALPADERRLRANLILEETVETLAALGFGFDHDAKLYERQPEHPAEQVKELSDLLYVVFGTFVTMGVDADPFFTQVHLNNLTKAGGTVRADGKRMKPEGYQPLDVRGIMHEYLKTHCNTCAAGGMMPPHFASPRCESGGYTHCSCDTCF